MLPVAFRRRTTHRRAVALRLTGAAASVVVLASLAACAPEPGATATGLLL